MNRNKIQFILLVTILCTTNLFNSHGYPDLDLSAEIVSISHEKTYFVMDLDYAMGLGGEFQLVLHLLDTSKTAIIFSYEVTTIVSIESNENINNTIILGMNSVNGSMEPGNLLRINHSVVECVSDMGVPFYFDFILILNSTAELSIDMVIFEYGEDTCPPQLGPDFSNIFLPFGVIILVVIILLIFRYISTRNGN